MRSHTRTSSITRGYKTLTMSQWRDHMYLSCDKFLRGKITKATGRGDKRSDELQKAGWRSLSTAKTDDRKLNQSIPTYF